MGKQFSAVQKTYLTNIQDYLRNFIDLQYPAPYDEMRNIFYYHLGLRDPIEKQGKRIRPLLMLICAEGVGVKKDEALPAAIAIELIHNFSLIHDDIEDNGDIRRGKPAVWKKWGLSQGLNAGDAMFNAAYLTISSLGLQFPPEIYTRAYELLSETCNELTKGQYLDMSFENQDRISIESYFQMIEGKTAALMACSSEMGALLGGVDRNQQKLFRKFGKKLGVAFQIYDDWLGIWGDEEKLGKSTVGDIRERKKSYPILLGLKSNETFRNRFLTKKMSDEMALELATALKISGIEKEVKATCTKWTNEALDILNILKCKHEQKEHLKIITNDLLIRSR